MLEAVIALLFPGADAGLHADRPIAEGSVGDSAGPAS
jgi:hypothetical protein